MSIENPPGYGRSSESLDQKQQRSETIQPQSSRSMAEAPRFDKLAKYLRRDQEQKEQGAELAEFDRKHPDLFEHGAENRQNSVKSIAPGKERGERGSHFNRLSASQKRMVLISNLLVQLFATLMRSTDAKTRIDSKMHGRCTLGGYLLVRINRIQAGDTSSDPDAERQVQDAYSQMSVLGRFCVAMWFRHLLIVAHYADGFDNSAIPDSLFPHASAVKATAYSHSAKPLQNGK